MTKIIEKRETFEDIKEFLMEFGFDMEGKNIEECSVVIYNHYGEFRIKIKDADVFFLPMHCIKCIKPCVNHSKYSHICIVEEQGGFTNIEKINGYLLLLSKIFAIREKNLPEHVWNQIKNSSKFCKYYPIQSEDSVSLQVENERNINDNQAIRENENRNRNQINPVITSLRDEMLQELCRLREIMENKINHSKFLRNIIQHELKTIFNLKYPTIYREDISVKVSELKN